MGLTDILMKIVDSAVQSSAWCEAAESRTSQQGSPISSLYRKPLLQTQQPVAYQ